MKRIACGLNSGLKEEGGGAEMSKEEIRDFFIDHFDFAPEEFLGKGSASAVSRIDSIIYSWVESFYSRWNKLKFNLVLNDEEEFYRGTVAMGREIGTMLKAADYFGLKSNFRFNLPQVICGLYQSLRERREWLKG